MIRRNGQISLRRTLPLPLLFYWLLLLKPRVDLQASSVLWCMAAALYTDDGVSDESQRERERIQSS